MTTPSQTVGPFFAFALPWPDGPYAAPPGTPGLITVHGTVRDGSGAPVPDALIETWQADPDGRFDHPDDPRGRGASGPRWFARCPTDADGMYAIHTVKPGPVPSADGPHAPHLTVCVLARGLLRQLVTRVYFPDETDANRADPVLSRLPDPSRASTLIAVPDGNALRFDIRLRGDDETVFFAL
ncbi:MAG TPA: protocatechuate 3,4-dioxygenase subunit alpha [Stackebrandtia sp.]|jgi:protocatechuate 3,4-dioxygenase alpha subunit|uniref:protocatechuate 3,4-dioxygenase subunit alpha n=1 Tax=Stackebrandtia sp. TaxID=2023065 RepID=UPI002D6CF69B|nr:protocatechuate 3,4-dioxygenase subunit alpha [Stackebrandtia sp.]HZE41353.1 protocatechuate 3,4-dioxygenase subunit alpha [Stackebrandtia sp.]